MIAARDMDREVFSRAPLRRPGYERTISIERSAVFISTKEGTRPAGYYRLSTDVPILLKAIAHARNARSLRSWPISGLSIVANPDFASVGLARLRPDGSRCGTAWFRGDELAALERACRTFLSRTHNATRTHDQ